MPPHVVFGAGGIGGTEKSFTFTWDTAEKVNDLLLGLKALGLDELDSAGAYPPGNFWNTETLLGETKAAENGFIIDSKVIPNIKGGRTLDEEGIENSIDKTLALLGAKKIRTYYAHFPDAKTPLEVTAAAFDKQYRAGKFERLGLCNYSVSDMARYFEICEEKGYIKPAVYQGNYNALYRNPEEDLLPLLRKHNCAFYAFSPLAGGFLTGKVTFAEDDPASESLERTRWRGGSTMPYYANLFDKPAYHEAIKYLKEACDSASPPLSLQEASLRWIIHHSSLQDVDAIIVGAKKLDQLQSNMADLRKGPLPQAIIDAVEHMGTIIAKDKSS